jgi:hypothetical protein
MPHSDSDIRAGKKTDPFISLIDLLFLLVMVWQDVHAESSQRRSLFPAGGVGLA